MKKSYLNDFIKNADGDYIYNGMHYEWVSPQPRKNHLVKLWAEAVTAAAMVIICGILPGQGMLNSFYVIIPYILEFCFTVLTLYALYRLTSGGIRLREYIYSAAVLKLPMRTYLIAINAAITFAAELVYVILHSSATIFSVDGAIILLQLVVSALGYIIHRQIDEIHWASH